MSIIKLSFLEKHWFSPLHSRNRPISNSVLHPPSTQMANIFNIITSIFCLFINDTVNFSIFPSFTTQQPSSLIYFPAVSLWCVPPTSALNIHSEHASNMLKRKCFLNYYMVHFAKSPRHTGHIQCGIILMNPWIHKKGVSSVLVLLMRKK